MHDALFPPVLSDPQAVSKYAESEVNIHYRAPIRTEVRYYTHGIVIWQP